MVLVVGSAQKILAAVIIIIIIIVIIIIKVLKALLFVVSSCLNKNLMREGLSSPCYK